MRRRTPGHASPGHASPGAACRRLPAADPKATAQWRLEAAFAVFERRYGG
ncbi:hypothetical protein [Streptomyces tamarix]